MAERKKHKCYYCGAEFPLIRTRTPLRDHIQREHPELGVVALRKKRDSGWYYRSEVLGNLTGTFTYSSLAWLTREASRFKAELMGNLAKVDSSDSNNGFFSHWNDFIEILREAPRIPELKRKNQELTKQVSKLQEKMVQIQEMIRRPE